MSSPGGKNDNRPNSEEAAPTANSGAGTVGPDDGFGEILDRIG